MSVAPASTEAAPTPRGTTVAAVVVLALALRLYGIGAESFWIDEIFQRDISAQPLAQIVADYRPRPGEAPLRDQAPLSHLLFHFFVGSGPRSDETLARLPSAFAGALNAGVFALLAARLVAPGVAVLATALLVVSPLDLWYGQECRFYELWMLLVTLSTYALVRVLDGAGARTPAGASWWAGYAIATIAGLYTCLMHGFVVAAQALTLLWGIRRRPALVGAAVLVVVVIGIATSPITSLVIQERGRPAGTARPPSLSVLPYTILTFAAGYSLGPTVDSLHALPSAGDVVRAHPGVVVVGLVFGLAAAAGLWRLRRPSLAAAVIVPLLLVPPAGVLALSYATRIVYNVRYALPALTAFLLVVAAGCLAPRRPVLRVIAVAAVLAVTAVADLQFYFDPRYDKADARGAIAAVRARGEPAHVVLAGDIPRVVDHYTRGTATTWQPKCEGIELPVSSRATLWVAAGRDWRREAPECLDRLAATHRVAEYLPFVGIELWKLTPRDGTAAR